MKTETAKSMIREGNYNITQIAAYLGFDSHSRFFKEIQTGHRYVTYGIRKIRQG